MEEQGRAKKGPGGNEKGIKMIRGISATNKLLFTEDNNLFPGFRSERRRKRQKGINKTLSRLEKDHFICLREWWTRHGD